MKLIGCILLGIFTIIWFSNSIRMLFSNLSRFAEQQKVATSGYVSRFVVVQVLNFGIVALAAWGSINFFRSSSFGGITSEKHISEQVDKANNVKIDLSEYISRLTKAIEDTRYFERIDKLYDSPAISDLEIIDVYDDFLVEMKKISPKTSEVLEVHDAYIQVLEGYVDAISKEGHVSAMFRFGVEQKKVMDRLNALCEKHGVKAKFQ